MSKNRHLRKTKIICTIGPASASEKILKSLCEAGMDIARINMSHGSREEHQKVIKAIKNLNKVIVYPIPILLDTQGPEIRTGDLKENYFLHVDEVIDITVGGGDTEEVTQDSAMIIHYKDLQKQLSPGDRITVDNGLINLDVIEKTAFGLRCRVVDGGLMKSRRHINLPGIRINLPSITSKDKQDIIFGIENDIDFIALSFVRTADDVEECRKIIQEKNGNAEIIAKIEDQLGAKNYKEIVEVSYGVMVARGDLGVEAPLEELPIIQRRLIKETAEKGKKCIIATHLLESMIENPIPTRAEVTDVANAAYEEADCVMLSGETSVGKYPLKCVEYLNTICIRSEKSGGIGWARSRTTFDVKPRLAKAAVEFSDSQRATAIIVITRRGYMANMVTSFHPQYSSVYAFTNMTKVRRKLMMNRGCYPFRIDLSNDPEKTIQEAIQLLQKRKLLEENSVVVIVSDVIGGDGRVDTIQVRRITN